MVLKSSPPRTESLGAVLVRQGRITEDQLGRALELQKSRNAKLGHILVLEEVISEEDLVRALAEQLGLPVFTISPMAAAPPRSRACKPSARLRASPELSRALAFPACSCSLSCSARSSASFVTVG